MKKVYELENCVAMNRKHPQTFHIPSGKEIKALKVGDYVKLIFVPTDEGLLTERMWVRITEKTIHGSFVGVLDNDPVSVPIECGDRVEFSFVHIASIF